MEVVLCGDILEPSAQGDNLVHNPREKCAFTVTHSFEVVLVRLLDLSQRVPCRLVVHDLHFAHFRDA